MRILKPVRLVKPVSRCAGFDIMNIPSDRAALFLQHGQPNLTLPLPSRGEPVLFTIKPVTGSVGSLINDIIKTDGGVHQAEILSKVKLKDFISAKFAIYRKKNKMIFIRMAKNWPNLPLYLTYFNWVIFRLI